MKPSNIPNNIDIVHVTTPSKPIATVVKQATSPGIGRAAPAPVTPPPPKPLIVPTTAPVLTTITRNSFPPIVVVPKIPIYSIPNVKKVDLKQFENFSADFARNSPEIIMIIDYVIDGQKIGNLILFKKYKTATHYEVFKRNMFSEISSFQRTLFLDSANLLQETVNFRTYVHEHVGLNNLADGSWFAVMDSLIKDDRIYEYKIVASRVPQNAHEVDYDYILESKNLVNTVDVDSLVNKTLFDFSVTTLGSKQLSWIIALLNRNLQFFGTKTFQVPVKDLITPDTKLVFPKKVAFIKNIFDDSVSLFGISNTINQIIDLLGGLSSDFRSSFNDSLNATSKTFSYASFINSVRKKVPIFDLLLTISEHDKNTDALNRLSQLNITVPNKIGTEVFTTIEGLSNIFYFVNSIIFVIIKSQDNSSTLQDLLNQLNTPPPATPPLVSKPPPPVQTLSIPTKPATVITPVKQSINVPTVTKILIGPNIGLNSIIKLK